MTLALAFLQARMGSTRLPGKVLRRIQGKSVLERAVERLAAARTLHGVVVLTTTSAEDAVVVEEAHRLGVASFRGPDEDVLTRYRQASDLFGPDIIIRATADNPLIDMGSIDRVVKQLTDERLDYCVESNLPIGAATEALTRAALERADRLGLLPRHREHVTLYIKEHRDAFRTAFPEAPEELRHPEIRITIDTPGDLVYVGNLIRAVPETGFPVPLRVYLEAIPSLISERLP